jgi:methionine sulfoxide reductase heme-binding subunit
MSMKAAFELLVAFLNVLQKKETRLDPKAFGIQSNQLGAVICWLADAWHLSLLLTWLPFSYVLLLIAFNGLGANPIEAFHLFTGIWSLRFLCITLMITPIQTMTGWRGMAAFRQLFGLMSFFYAALHVYGYLSIDFGMIGDAIMRDILETPYLWPGIVAFFILTLLAISSPTAGKKFLGKNWKRLHRWIYAASLLVILHYVMQLKGNLADPLLYGLLLVVLFAFRGAVWIRNRKLVRLMIPRVRKLGVDAEEGG